MRWYGPIGNNKKWIKMNIQFKYFKTFCLLIAGAMITVSCKQYDNPPPVFEELKDLTTLQRKVLVISIDGLTGTELQEVAPANITALQKNSKYSYNALKTASSSGGWVSMLTGTSYAKHGIRNDNFEAHHEHDHNHGDIKSYRNILDYVTQYKAVKTAMVSSWDNLRYYVRNADFAPVVDDDVEVRDSAIALLETEQGLGVIFVNFRGVLDAGHNGGYSASNPVYKEAIVQSDGYVGDILEALKKRKNYEKEDWLVIVTTNHGGSSEDPENGFVLVYNPAFEEFELKKSGFNSVAFNPSSVYGEIPDDDGLYDAGATEDFTVQMDVKFNVQTRYPGFLSKSTALLGQSITGWLWMQSFNDATGKGNWGVVFGGTANGGAGKTQISGGSDVFVTGAWNTLTMVVKTTGGTTPTARTVSCYVDGVETGTGNILGVKSLSTLEQLRVGYRNVDNGGTGLNMNVANLTYFNTALNSATVQSTFGLQDITQHPNYANVIGFWPMDEGTEGTFFNKAPGGYDMPIHGLYRWDNLADLFPPSTTPEPITSTLSIPATASDIAALTMYWMKIEILADFSFDGKAYLKEFELEFLKD
jgi:hypothetical protein